MKRILIAYATTDGQTRKIAETIAEWIRSSNHEAVVLDTGKNQEMPDGPFDGFIVAGSLHMQKHQKSLIRFVTNNAKALSEKPALFLSVSMAAHGQDERNRAGVRKCIEEFERETGWKAKKTIPVAGALKYLDYNWLTRIMMKRIVKKEGGDIDTSRNYEYTDWDALQREVDAFTSDIPNSG